MTPRLIDTHCHIHFPPFADDRDAVLERMREKNVWGITVGTTAGSSEGAVQFAEAHEGIWAAVGYHPEHFSSDFRAPGEEDEGEYSIDELCRIATSSKKVVAIGETGLDFFRIDEGRNADEAKTAQERGLRDQLSLAAELNLPIIIHCRDAFTRLTEILQEYRQTRGVVHCFTGTWEEAKPLLDLGLHLSFTGIITFPPKKSLDPETLVQRVIERMPMEKLLVETDAPWLSPVPYRGQRNEPVYVEETARFVGMLRGVELEEIAKTTTENARGLFRI